MYKVFNIEKIIKKIPRIEKFLKYYNPDFKYLIEKSGILNNEIPTVIDVGANSGQTIDLILLFNPKTEIFSFEPTKELVNSLVTKYTYKYNVHIFDMALSDIEGESDLFTTTFSSSNSLLEPNRELYDKFGDQISKIFSTIVKTKCRVNTFDNWYKTTFPEGRIIDLLKVDTQGSDYNVLSGAVKSLQQQVKAVAIEIQYLPFYLNSKPFYSTFEFLYDHGFYLFSFYENNKRNNLQLIENNALFLNRSFYNELI